MATQLICAKCSSPVSAAYVDDVGTQWYRCGKCGYTTIPVSPNFLVEPVPPRKEDFQNPANYQNALAEYRHNLQVYQARLQWLRERAAAEKKIEYPDLNYFCPTNDYGARKPLKPAEVAIWLAQNDYFKTDRETDILYHGDPETGKWTDDGETVLKEILAKILGNENKECHYRNILFALKSLTYADITFSRKIACQNGLLDPETLEFTPFNLDEMAYHQIPVKYDPTATCPNWEAFIAQVVASEDIPLLQEWSGYLLLPDYRFHKILWLYGSGRNGKGVWQRTMEAILGVDNVSSLTLEEFDGTHRFALKQLYGKLFNPCSEPTTNRILQTPLLKKATGQDTLDAEIKGKQQRIQFRNYAKITVIANRFPRVNDQSTAFKQRCLFLSFPNEFISANQVQNIEDNWLKVTDERSGILNWMLQGLQRLLSQGHFSESKTQKETETAFLRASDTIGAFLSEVCVFGKNLVTTRSEAYDAYKNYCDIFGLEAETEKRFTARLKETPKVTVAYVRTPKQERAWKGLGLKTIDEEGKIFDFATDATSATGNYILGNSTAEKIKENKIHVADVASVADAKNQPTWYVKPIPNGGEKCECGALAVQYELLTPSKDTLRRCSQCFEQLKRTYTNARWLPAHPDLAIYGEADV